MNRIISQLILIAFIFLSIAGCNQVDKKIVDKFEDGKPRKVQYFDKKGQMVSEEEFYPSGQKHYHGEYLNGKRNGKWVFWFEDGKKWSEGYFVNGVRNGMARVYHENGKLFYTGNYVDGKKDGQWVFYDQDGKKTNEIMFDKGVFQNQVTQPTDSLKQ
jgi:antitoxin component YwqK of YwqJK toxin-antitoxin module